MSLDAVAGRCAQETQKFLAKQGSESAYCFELFRRALELRDEHAWEHVYHQYQDLVASWISAHSELRKTGEDLHFFVNQAFINFYRVLQSPGKFARFASLSALLSYLRACAHSAVRDEARKHTIPEVELPDYVEMSSDEDVQVMILDSEMQGALVNLIGARLKSRKEEVILESCFGLDLKPREVYQRYADLFDSQQEVYRVKQNLLERLRRDTELQALWQEQIRT
ncbi:MAG: sigma-70 family RNA polymerase sigma factor [Caldilineaceae bacterium]|nr:sigma-70 family RNA polymerase sigma factor [Caldilineaceae bacterium]